MGRPRPIKPPAREERPRPSRGRPRVYDDRVSLATRVLPGLRDRITREAARLGVSVSRYIADVLDRHTP